jgi:hypothetical protein
MIILGIEPVAWQDTQYVLRQFGPTENEARRCYLLMVNAMSPFHGHLNEATLWSG